MMLRRRPAPAEADSAAELAQLRAEIDDLRRRLAATEAAADVLPVGFVVRHADGTRLRNGTIRAMAAARGADLLADQAVEEALNEAATGRRVERTLELHGPPRRVLVISARPLDGGAVAVVEDATGRHQLEAVRRDFVANVSHELRTPLGALGALADAISDSDDVDVVRRLAGRMAAEVARAARLVDDLLDLSRIEATGVANPVPVDVASVVEAAVERVRAVAAECSVEVEVAAAAGELVVSGDQEQLVSAVANLVENGVKYSPPASTVTVSVSASDGAVELSVRDRGMGIPSRDLERVFERFYRVDRARSRDTGGTGLGLAIVRNVAENHGGDVSVDSVEGQGSVFTLRLPRGSS
jgi:two-component system, OmpR family, sensor histidine kinase SenX3